MASGWTPERTEILKDLWGKGWSGSAIGAVLGISRNAVIGKAFRLKLAFRGTTVRRSQNSTRQHRRYKAAKPTKTVRFNGNPAFRELMAEPWAPQPEPVIPPKERVKLLDLTETSCRWPIGDPQEADFGFCPRTHVVGLPYCDTHSRIAFDLPRPKVRTPPAEQPQQPRHFAMRDDHGGTRHAVNVGKQLARILALKVEVVE